MLSANNSKLVQAGKRFRGSIHNEKLKCNEAGINPTGNLISDILSPSWCGFVWSEWSNFTKTIIELKDRTFGLYRIKRNNDDLLLI